MSGQDGFAVGVDLGTSNTVAVLRWPDGRTRPLLFDGAPMMPSAVCLDDTGRLQVGRDALRLAALDPARLELNPKRRIDESSVLLGGHEVPTVDLLAAILGAVARSAVEAVGFLPPAALTYPASWGAQRREVLASAAQRAGWPPVRFVPEPVAAARYFADVLRRPVPVGSCIGVFDFGGGTLDVAVVRNSGAGFEVLGDGGVEDLGGLDVDAELVAHLGRLLETTSALNWSKLDRPANLSDARSRRLFWEDVRGAKEMLSRTPVAPVAVPGMDDAVHLTREELERIATPLVQRAVRETAAVIQRCGLRPDQLTGLFLVGGSSRLPLVARMLHSQLGIAPTVLEQPELPVAEGALAELVPPSGSASLTTTTTATTTTGPISAPPAGSISAPPAGSISAPSTGPVSPGGTFAFAAGPPQTGLLTHPGLPGPRVGEPTPIWVPPATTRRPLYRRTRVLVAAGVALLLIVAAGVGTALWLHRAGAEEVGFASVTPTGDPIPMGSPAASPSTTLTAISGNTAYLGYADDDGLHIIVHPLHGGADHSAVLAAPAGISVAWQAFVARPGIVLVYSYDYGGKTPIHIYGLNPVSGATVWDQQMDSGDQLIPVGPTLVWDDTTHNQVVGLAPATGKQLWATPDPKTGSGFVTTALRAAYSAADLAAPSALGDHAPLVLAGTHLVQVDYDGSVQVFDVTNGHTVSAKGITDPTDLVFGSGDSLFVAGTDAAYQVHSYPIKDPGSDKGAEKLFTGPDTARPIDMVPCGSGVCVLDRSNSDPTTATVHMIDSSGQRWFQLVAGADSLTALGDGVIVSSSQGKGFTRIFNAKGDELALDTTGVEAVGVRVNGASALLLKGTVATYPYTVALTGVGTHSGKVKPLGSMDGVRAAACSWNTQVIVCPQESQFQVWKFAA